MSGFSFSNPPATSASTNIFGGSTAPTATSSSSGFSFGTSTASAAPAAMSFGSFSANPTTFSVNSGGSGGAVNTFGAQGAGLGVVNPATGIAPTTFNQTLQGPNVFGTLTKVPVTTQAPTLGSSWSVVGADSNRKVNLATSLAQTPTVPQQGGFGTSFNTTSTTTPAAAAAAATPASAPTGQMTFEELEKRCQEWKKELDRQEESFLKRATQINAWDRLIRANSDRITELHGSMMKVKTDHEALERELDFVEAQQTDLEEMLGTLERQAEAMNAESIQIHADVERESTYHAAGRVNLQLQTMADSIKDIIERINANNRSSNNESPMELVSRILNTHMDALQTIQSNLGVLQTKIEDVNKLMGVARM